MIMAVIVYSSRGKTKKVTIFKSINNRLCLFFEHQVKDHLFDDSEIGIDLIAINMQRGRDHGLPGYIDYRRICNPGKTFETFEDLKKDMAMTPDVGIHS